MGIAVQGLITLLVEMKRRRYSGRILQIGRQDVYFDYLSLKKYAKACGIELADPGAIGHRSNQWTPGVDTIDDVTLFKSLGFETVESVDVSDYESPTFVHDFNLPIGQEHCGAYDVVYDGGSLEHIFNVPCALANMTRLLTIGGRVIHEVPVHNFIDHGFYQFSPGFFTDFYEANNYASIQCRIVGMKAPLRHDAPPHLFNYEPGSLESLAIGGFRKEFFHGCEMLSVFFVAEKTRHSTGTTVPVQRRYRQWWSDPKFHNHS